MLSAQPARQITEARKARSGNRLEVDIAERTFERPGPGWEQTRESVAGEGGWPGCLERFAERVGG